MLHPIAPVSLQHRDGIAFIIDPTPLICFNDDVKDVARSRLASGVLGGASGLVEFHLDSTTGPTIATIAIGNSGGRQSWTTVPMNTSSVTGTRAVYIVFRSGQ